MGDHLAPGMFRLCWMARDLGAALTSRYLIRAWRRNHKSGGGNNMGSANLRCQYPC